jgi:hypothetical protein
MSSNSKEKFRLSVRVCSNSLSPKQISDVFGVGPDQFRSELPTWKCMWEYDPPLVESNFQDRLLNLIVFLESKKINKGKFPKETMLVFWGCVITPNPESSIYLSPNLMRRLSELGIEFYFSSYFSGE